MSNGISRHKIRDMSQLVRLEGKLTVQTAHCALLNLCQTKKDKLFNDSPSLNVSKIPAQLLFLQFYLNQIFAITKMNIDF